VRRALAVLLMIGAAAPAASASVPPHRLFVIGDSLAYDNSRYLHHALPRWKIEENFSFARSSQDTAHDLRVRARAHPRLAPVIHVSSGTGDEPEHPEGLRRSIRRVMRVAGEHRCVVWANIWRLRLEQPTFDTLNEVLAEEDAARANLRVIDWHTMVEAHRDWLVDPVHVNAEGNRARADAVAHEARACRASLKTPAPLPGPLPARIP
jgi:lysophospholipase L1-like esterase